MCPMVYESSSVDSVNKDMPREKYIKVEELQVLRNRLLISRFSYSKNIKRYFLSDLFHVEYDEDIHSIDKSILYVPVVSSLITLAWAIGADIYVEELDKSFLESLNKIKSVMKNWYPKFPFSTTVYFEKVGSNSFYNDGYALLFSGGLDSTTSYIKHKEKKPNLITVWGANYPLTPRKLWLKIKDKYKDFARQENVKINFIETNTRRFLHERLLRAEFGGCLPDFSWWGGYRHGLTLLSLCAPITVGKIGTLMIAASHTGEFMYPWGSHPLIDNKLSWADVRVVHDGYELSRQEKIRYLLKNYIRNNGYYPPLRVCWVSSDIPNCGKCEKCSELIIGLLLENIDPDKFGFKVSNKFFDFLKQNLSQLIQDEYDAFMWRDIQQNIPETIDHNLHNCREFFDWLRTFDPSLSIEPRNLNIMKDRFLYIYFRLPIVVQNMLSNVLYHHELFFKPIGWLL